MAVFVFDMDGVIIDSEMLYLEREKEFFRYKGMDYDDNVMLKTVGSNGKDCFKLYKEEIKGFNYNSLEELRKEKREYFKDRIIDYRNLVDKNIYNVLKELKKRVPVAENCGLVMGSVELLHSGAEIVVKETVDNGVAISVFDNGYVLYEEDKHRTVFRLHDCSGYEYKHSETEIETFGEAFFENENWYVLPLMVGMDRVEASRCAILANHGVLSTDVVEYDFLNNKNICVPDFIDKILWEEMVREFAEFLNERQMYAVISYYYLGVSQEEIAKELNVSQQAASGLIRRTLAMIRKYMNVNPDDVKRNRNKK